VKDRNLQHLRDVGAIRAGRRLIRRCRESELVVHDDVKGAPCLISGEFTEIESFLNDAFTCEARIAMDQHCHASLACSVSHAILLCANSSQSNGIHKLQVARIEA